MATCELSVKAIRRVVELIDELNAWKKVLSRHAGQQTRQMSWPGIGGHVYDKKINKVVWKAAK